MNTQTRVPVISSISFNIFIRNFCFVLVVLVHLFCNWTHVISMRKPCLVSMLLFALFHFLDGKMILRAYLSLIKIIYYLKLKLKIINKAYSTNGAGETRYPHSKE